METRWLTTSTTSRRRGRTWRPERGRRSLTASEAAALIGVSVATVRGWADDGRLPSYRTEGGHRRFELDELRAWLTRRGASAPESRRFTRAPQEVPACPLLARELNARTESIVARTLAGYDGDVATPLPAAERARDAHGSRCASSGWSRPGSRPAGPRCVTGQTELAGLRGGLQGSSGVRVIVEHTRVALAILMEAEAVERDGVQVEPLAIPALLAVIDHAQAAVARGFEQAQGLRPGRGPSSALARRAGGHPAGVARRETAIAVLHEGVLQPDAHVVTRRQARGHDGPRRAARAVPQARPSERRHAARRSRGPRRPRLSGSSRKVSTRIRRTRPAQGADRQTVGVVEREHARLDADAVLEHGNAERERSRPRTGSRSRGPAASPTPGRRRSGPGRLPGRCRPPLTARSRARARPRAPRRPPRPARASSDSAPSGPRGWKCTEAAPGPAAGRRVGGDLGTRHRDRRRWAPGGRSPFEGRLDHAAGPET